MLRATSPVRDFSGLRPAVLCLAVPRPIVGRHRSCWIVLHRNHSAPALTAQPSAVEPPGIPGTRRSIPRFAPSRRAPCNRSLEPRAERHGRPDRAPTGRLHRMPGRRGSATPSRSFRCKKPAPAEASPHDGSRTTDPARLASTRCTSSLLSGRGPARPAPLDPSQVTDFSYGYAKL